MRAFALAMLVALPSQVMAADLKPPKLEPTTPAEPSKPDLTVDIGAGAIVAPRFPGAKRYQATGIPYVAFNYKDVIFASKQDGLGANILNYQGFQAGPVVNVEFPRLEKDDRRYLRGLGDVATTLEAGGFVKYSYAPFFSAKIEVRKGVAGLDETKDKISAAQGIRRTFKGHDGIIATLSADVSAPPLFDNRLFLSAGPRAEYYDKNYAKAYFGVTALQSQRSGYAAFTPKAGVGKVGFGGAAIFLVTANVSFTTFADYGRLLGDVSKSPLVRGKGGSKDQFTLGSALSYRFSL